MKTLELFPSGLLCRGLICIALSVLLGAAGVSQSTFTDERTRSSGSILPENPDKGDKNTVLTRITPGDALINGLTLGRGSGDFLYNAAFGHHALFTNTLGNLNTATGWRALYANTTGYYNTAAGAEALSMNTTANANTAIGAYALLFNTTGYFNTAMGGDALIYNTIGKENTAIGIATIASNISGNYNTAVGSRALTGNVSGHSNVAIGVHALYYSIDKNNLVAVGDSALYYNGFGASESYQSAFNTALGSKALYKNTLGSFNTATGHHALRENTTGFANTAGGHEALRENMTGSHNTAYGTIALQDNTTGYGNTAFGSNALSYITTESYNTAVGMVAGGSSSAGGTFVGYYAYALSSGFSNVTGIGYYARPTGSNQVRLGNSSVTSIGGQVGWTTVSDGGYKRNIGEDVAGLQFILGLRPISYNLDVHKLAADLEEDAAIDERGTKTLSVPDETNKRARDEKTSIRYTGFIAQEVEATVNKLGVTFSGVDAPTNKNGHYGLRYADFVVPLVKAVQEQQAQIEALSPEGFDAMQEEITALRSVNEHLLAAEAVLSAENAALTLKQSAIDVEVTALRAENESIRGQINDILALLNAHGTELGTLNFNLQDCCNKGQEGLGHVPGQVNTQQEASDNAKLEQNAPNPFHENTLIRYYLPQETQRASIVITDLGGTQVMSIPLEGQGVGQALINGGSLATGTYVYTLVVDGRQVDSKRMVLL
jgi:hypothetical protein